MWIASSRSLYLHHPTSSISASRTSPRFRNVQIFRPETVLSVALVALRRVLTNVWGIKLKCPSLPSEEDFSPAQRYSSADSLWATALVVSAAITNNITSASVVNTDIRN